MCHIMPRALLEDLDMIALGGREPQDAMSDDARNAGVAVSGCMQASLSGALRFTNEPRKKHHILYKGTGFCVSSQDGSRLIRNWGTKLNDCKDARRGK